MQKLREQLSPVGCSDWFGDINLTAENRQPGKPFVAQIIFINRAGAPSAGTPFREPTARRILAAARLLQQIPSKHALTLRIWL